MREVIDYIEQRRKQYESHDLFVRILANESLPGERRLAWGPSVVPFIMGYSDLNKFVFRKGENEPSLDPLQILLNAHTYEEDFHWQWMLNDLARLGADSSMPLSDAARVLWGEDLAHSRRLCLGLAALASGAPTHVVFAMVESIEAVSITIFEQCRGITLSEGDECEFFGSKHYQAEASHSIKAPEIEKSALPVLTDDERAHALLAVDRVFALFDDWSDALLRYAARTEDHQLAFVGMVRRSKALLPDGA